MSWSVGYSVPRPIIARLRSPKVPKVGEPRLPSPARGIFATALDVERQILLEAQVPAMQRYRS